MTVSNQGGEIADEIGDAQNSDHENQMVSSRLGNTEIITANATESSEPDETPSTAMSGVDVSLEHSEINSIVTHVIVSENTQIISAQENVSAQDDWDSWASASNETVIVESAHCSGNVDGVISDSSGNYEIQHETDDSTADLAAVEIPEIVMNQSAAGSLGSEAAEDILRSNNHDVPLGNLEVSGKISSLPEDDEWAEFSEFSSAEIPVTQSDDEFEDFQSSNDVKSNVIPQLNVCFLFLLIVPVKTQSNLCSFSLDSIERIISVRS